MVADLKKNCVFVHIPKCAGCSVEEWLGFKQDSREIYKGSYPFAGRSRRCLSHLTAYELQQELTKPVFDLCFSFGVVRNPYDRMISEFYWLYAYDIEQIRSDRTGIQDSFNSFIQRLDRIRTDKTSIQPDIHFDHYEPQYTFLHHPVTGQQLVKKIGRVESLESFLAEEVQPAIGNFYPTGKLKYINRTKKKAEDVSIMKDNKELIFLTNELFRRDFEIFGYEMRASG